MKLKYGTLLFYVLIILAAIYTSACKKQQTSNNVDCSTINAKYAANVEPIIAGSCISSGCHNANSVNGDFTTYNGLKTVANNGTLNSNVLQQKAMPPAGSLSKNDLDIIQCWINSGSLNN